MRSTVKLINGEEALKILSEQAPVGACIMQDGKFYYINSFFLSATGYTADELVGKDSLEIVVPEDRDVVRDNTVKMLKGDIVSPYQFRAIRKDNGIIWVMATVKSIQYRGRQAVLGNYMEITGRKQIEEALKDSEQRYKELAGSITDIFFAMDEHLRYTYWNKASEILTGIGEEYAIGRSLLEVFPDTPATRNAEKVYRNVLKTREPRTFVNDFDIGDRHYVFEISAYPSRGGISVFAKDITERKQAERRVREAEEEKSALLEEAPVSIIHADLDGRITYVNKRFELEAGYSREEILGKPGLQLGWFSPDTTEYFAQRMADRLRGGPAKHWETPFKCKDGRRIWVELEGKILEKLGVPLGFQIIATNITERKQAEEALRQSEERYRTMLEEMEEGYYEVDVAGIFTFVNDAMSRILGYSRDELIGMNYEIYTPKEYVNPIFEAYNRVYQTGKPLKWFPMPEIRKDGTRILAEDSVFPLRNEKGETIGFRGISRDITERRQAEEALKESEEKYRTILEEMEDSYFEVDLGGHLSFVNNSVCRDLGYSREELIGKSYKAFTVEEDIESVFRVFNEVYRTGVPNKGFPWRTIRKDGTRGFAETSISLLRNGKGQIIGFRGVGRDISERKQAEERLRQSEEKYKALFDNSVTGTLVVDAETTKVLIGNQAAAEMFGFSSGEEGIGANILDFVPPQQKEKALDLIRKELFEQDSRQTFDLQAVTKDGRTIWISATGARITHGDRLAGLLSFADITERKKMEEALKLAAAEWSMTFDSISDAVSIHDKDFRILRANKAFADLFQKSLNEIIGTHCYELHKGEKPRSGCPHQHTLTSGKPAAAEFYESNLGKHLYESTSPIFNEQGEAVGTVHITRDITEQKLQSDKLMMTDRLASLGELASGAAHELNNPLTSIIGFSQLLMEREVPDDIREDLKLINSEAQRAASVTRNLVTFGRKHAPMKEPNQINNIIDDVLRLRTHEHKANSIEIEKHLAPDLPEAMVDYFQMQQVFINIIINAEYFMTNAHNRGTLTITTKEQNDTVVILFTDDGPGIPPENLRRIFDPFFTTKEAGKGTGLGLSICHALVTDHGGQIYAKSQLGKGATLVVELPANSRRPS